VDDPLPFDDLAPTRKRCSMCKQWFPLEEFHRNRARRDGRQHACKTCNIERNKRWYREHPEVRGARMDEYNRRRKRKLQALLLEYLGSHPCVDCGEADPVVLDFDHLRDKVANVSLMVLRKRPWSVILEEIAKCEVRCANCHRRKTAAEARTYRYLHSQGDW
jgi:hypothetical protein